MSEALRPPDLRLLKAIVDIGHRLEKVWGSLHDRAPELEALRANIAACAHAEAPSLKRLAFHVRDLHTEISARHLATILVPFERLLGRALRDDEFLITENDEHRRPRATVPMIAIADNLRSAFNVGAIVRTSEALGLSAVWLTGYTPTPDGDKTARTSMGSEDAIQWEQLPRANDAIKRAKAEGYTVVALETAGVSETLDNFIWPERVALLVGNERFGVDRETLAGVDRVLTIPLYGVKNSLNVGIAFGIAAQNYRQTYERFRSAQAMSLSMSLSMAMATTPAAVPTPTPDASEGLRLQSIGVFRSPARYPYEARRQASEDASAAIGEIKLFSGRQFEQALDDLAGFERIWLIYGFHQNSHWKPKTLPPRGPRIKRGVFATRSPYRPNPLGISAVELIRVDGLSLQVRGFDLLDGTPIYDIKPYLPYSDAFPSARTGWTEDLNHEAYDVHFSPLAENQLAWLTNRGVDQLKFFLAAQLEFDPIDGERKRVRPIEGGDKNQFCLSYRTWRADFTLSPLTTLAPLTPFTPPTPAATVTASAMAASKKSLVIDRLRSGYTTSDLAPGEADPYGDKEVHRDFNELYR